MRTWFWLPNDDRQAPAMVGRTLAKALRDGHPELGLRVVHGSGRGVPWRAQDVLLVPKSPFLAPDTRTMVSLRARMSRVKVVSILHGDFVVESAYLRRNRRWGSYLATLPTVALSGAILMAHKRIVVNSPWMARLLQDRHGGLLPLQVIPNALPESVGRPQPIELEGDPAVVYHGRLAIEKGVDLLVKALTVYLIDHPKTVLHIIGDGPLRYRLRDLAKRRDVTHAIRFHGYLTSKHRVDQMLVSADRLVYPSRYEPFGIAQLEAMSLGASAPVISARTGVLGFLPKDATTTFEPTVAGVETGLRADRRPPIDPTWLHDRFSVARIAAEYAALLQSLAVEGAKD